MIIIVTFICSFQFELHKMVKRWKALNPFFTAWMNVCIAETNVSQSKVKFN